MITTDTKIIAGIISIIILIVLGWIIISTIGQPFNAQSSASAKEFVVTGTPFKMEPAEIKVKQGDRVKIIFKNEEGFHNLAIKDLNITTKNLQKGEQETIEFTADKTGTFQYNCSVPTHTEKGMVGNLIVE